MTSIPEPDLKLLPPPEGTRPDEVVRQYIEVVNHARREHADKELSLAAECFTSSLAAQRRSIVREQLRAQLEEQVLDVERTGAGRVRVHTNGEGGGPPLAYDMTWTSAGWRLSGIWAACEECDGSGSCPECARDPWRGPDDCSACEGHGRCPSCHGEGEEPWEK